MAQPKQSTMYGMTAELEPSYGAGGTIDEAEDGVLIIEPAIAERTWVHEGAYDAEAARGVPLKREVPSGEMIAFPANVVARGAGAAYSATVTPPFVHDLLRAAGFSATLDATVGSEKYTYAPEDPATATMASIFGDLYVDEETWAYTHAIADLEIVIEAGGFVRFNFSCSALPGADPSDQAIPTITYSSQSAPKAVNTAFKIGLFDDAVWSEIRIALNRTVGQRADGNSAGHAGFVGGGFEPTLEVDMEKFALSGAATPTADTIDPHLMFKNAEEVALEATIGSVQYNTIKFAAAQAQLSSDPTRDEDDPRALWTLPFELKSSAVGLVDFLSIVFS